MKVKNYFEYFQYFYKLKGLAGNFLWIMIVNAMIASFLESLGITMVIPLLESTLIEDSTYGYWVKDIFTSIGFTFSTINVLIFILFIFLLKALMVFTKSIVQGVLSRRLVIKLKINLRDQYFAGDYRSFIKRDSGYYTNLLNTQTDEVLRFLENFSKFSSLAITCAIYLIMAFTMHVSLSLVLIVFGAVTQLIFSQLAKRIRYHSSFIVELTSDINSKVIQSIQFIKFLKSTNRLTEHSKKLNEIIHRLANHRYYQNIIGGVSQAISEPVVIIFLVSIIYIQTVVLNQSILPLMVVLILFYRTMNYWLIAQSAWINTMSCYGALEMVNQNFEESKAIREPSGDRAISFNHTISFKDVDFNYDSNQVIEQVNFDIHKNKTVAFVGPSGSGKTTLADMLPYLIAPANGSIYIDNVNMNDIDLGSWRSQIGYVSQDVAIFNESISHNIDLNFDGSDENLKKIISAAKKANCHDFISATEKGYHTILGERGISISGGQKQRIGIARELYKNPQLLILDEATSALDPITEERIKKSIDKIHGKLTIVIIAHRYSTIKNVDVIYLLDHGKIVDQGNFDHLYKSNAYFKQQVQLSESE